MVTLATQQAREMLSSLRKGGGRRSDWRRDFEVRVAADGVGIDAGVQARGREGHFGPHQIAVIAIGRRAGQDQVRYGVP